MLKRTALLYRDSFSGLPLEIWWLSLVMLINRAGALVLPFLTVYLTEQLGFSLSKTGLIMSFYGLGSICGAYMGGKLTDRFGPFNVQFTSLFLSGLMFLVLMQLDTVQEFCVGIFFTSMIMDAFRPANMAAIGFYAPPELHTRAVALNRFAINLGFAMGPAMGGVLAGALGFGALFIFNAGAYVLAALVFRLTLRPPDRGAIPKDADGAPIAASTSPWQDYTFIKFVLCHFLGIFAFMQLFSTLPVYLKSTLGWGEDMIGYLIGLNGLLIVVIEMPMIFRLEKHPSKVWLAAIGAGFIFLGFLLLGLFSGLAFAAWVFMILITIGEMINFPFGNSYALSRTTPQNRGRFMGVYSLAFSVSMVLGPNFGMFVAEHGGFSLLWLIMAGMALGGMLGLLSLHRADQHKRDAQAEKEPELQR